MRRKTEIEMGDVFWDENHKWSRGSDTINFLYIVLSADQKRYASKVLYLYRCACFTWFEDRYCGAHDRGFTEKEVLLMTKVGNIRSIKSFGDVIKQPA